MRAIREHRDPLIVRVRVMSILIALLLVGIVGGFFSVQVSRGDYYRELAENNRLRRIPVRAPRGLIYDRQGRLLVENIPSYDLMLDRSRARDARESLAFAAGILGVPVEELEARLEEHRDVPDFKPVALARRLSLAQVARFGAFSLEYPEFEIDVQHLRLYRHGPQTGHLLGYLGEVTEEDVDRNPEVYDPGDLIGKRGVEEVFDRHLRGEDGSVVVIVDSRGKVVEEYGKEEATPGDPLILSIDLALQQEAERQLRDHVGAVVAIEPKTGEILALYSSPAYNSNVFARGLTQEEWTALVAGEHNPLQNRAIQNAHSPGSVFKIVMGAAGLSEGVITPGTRQFCGGGDVFYGRRYGCWKPGGHGSVDLHAAIKGSCNVYFYHLGKKLGVEKIAKYARMFGLGEVTGVPLGGEKPGLVPDEAWSQRVRGDEWWPGETISLSVGQGPLLTTPIQLARMVAAVANGKELLAPKLVKGGDVREAEDFEVSPSALVAVKEGLSAVVNEPGGTGYWSARIPEIAIAGKTGTAQVVGKNVSSGKADAPYEQRTHAWFVSFAPVEDPELAVVVFVEHGGSGSGAAAPIAKILYETYFKAELAEARKSENRRAG